MWLKLTGHATGIKVLVNMAMASAVDVDTSGRTVIIRDVDNFMPVKETVEEIELMLMGSKPSTTDPRERNVIGRIPGDFHKVD